MKNIQSFDNFTLHLEEINWKKAAAGLALGASLAAGSPQQAKSQTRSGQEIQKLDKDLQSTEWSKVVQVEGKSASEIQMDLYRLLNELRASEFGPNSTINFVNPTPAGPNRISATIQFNIEPEGTNGVTEGELEILIKDGKYKVIIRGAEFIHVGMQPRTAGEQARDRYRPMVGSAVAQQARQGAARVLRPAIGEWSEVAGNIVGNVVQDVVTRPSKTYTKKNFEVGDEKPSGLSDRAWKQYGDELSSAVDYFFELLTKRTTEDDDF